MHSQLSDSVPVKVFFSIKETDRDLWNSLGQLTIRHVLETLISQYNVPLWLLYLTPRSLELENESLY
jgi:hypothetical protein